MPTQCNLADNVAGCVELLAPSEMTRADRAAADAAISSYQLMENAGRSVFRAIRARIAPCRTLVLCGPGSNGGDGFVAARLLLQAGWPVAVAALAGSPRRGDSAMAAQGW